MATTTTLYIKNMVCNRCIMVVKDRLEALGLHPLSVPCYNPSAKAWSRWDLN